MGKSLSFRGAVREAQDLIRHHHCKDPVCDTQLWKLKHELDMCRIKIRKLENYIYNLKWVQDKKKIHFWQNYFQRRTILIVQYLDIR